MSNDLYGNRPGERLRYDLLDAAGHLVEADFDGVQPSGIVDMSEPANPDDIERSATITVDRSDIDWATHRVRISYAGAGLTIPLITALVKAPTAEHAEHGVSQPLTLFDHTQILADDQFGRTTGYELGAGCVATAAAVVESTTTTLTLTGDSIAALSAPLTFDASTSKLAIARGILDTGNLLLRADPLGRLIAPAWVPPADRPVAFGFEYGERSVYLPDFTRAQDLTGAPNRWVCIQRTDSGQPAAVYAAEDTRSDSPFSYGARGRWITGGVETVDAADYQALQAIAWRRLIDAQQVADEITITHAVLPGVVPGARVDFEHPHLGVVPATVVKQRYVENGDVMVQTTIRRIL